MQTIAIIAAASIAAFFAIDPMDGQVKGTGEVIRKGLTVAPFHGIEVEGSIDVVLKQAGAQSVEVEAQANIVELITTEVKNGVWIIGTREGYSTDKPFVVHVSVPNIDVVHISGSGDVKSESMFTVDNVDLQVQGSGDITVSFTAKTIKALIQGSGDVEIKGTCTTLQAEVEGSGDVDADDLKAQTADVEVAGSGDISVNVSESLEAAVAGSGNVTYVGKPAKLDKSVAGSGTVKQAD